MSIAKLLAVSGCALIAALAAPSAGAAAQRTFVASNGSDANACTLTAPCRTFTAAIAQTNVDGEVIVLDSAGYGAATISKAVTIIAPAGVYAGVSVATGTGFIVSPPSGTVRLRGLRLNAQGGSVGIDFQSGDELIVEDVAISGFSGQGIVARAPGMLIVEHSTIDNCGSGIEVTLGTGTTRGYVARSRIGGIVFGISITKPAVFVVIDTTVGRPFTGIYVQPLTGTADVRCERCVILGGTNGVWNGGSAGATTNVRLGRSRVEGFTGSGIMTAAGGTTFVSDSDIASNATALNFQGNGAAYSFGDNRLMLNSTNGSFSLPAPGKM